MIENADIAWSRALTNSNRWGLAALLILNLIPLWGVLHWGWRSFDLIFLYWLENLVIGLFTVLRMLLRPYGHAIELIFPLFLVPFFALHYGGFSWGHGTFVLSLFGPDEVKAFEPWTAAVQLLGRDSGLLLALGSLMLMHALDWLQQIRTNGLGVDSVVQLMVKPYRRIVVLHLTIIGAGFALTALHEPFVGLLMLVLIKTLSDVWHWRHDHRATSTQPVPVLDEQQMAQLREQYAEPVVTVNGQERRFASFAQMKASKEFRMAQAVMRIMGARDELHLLRTYIDERIAQEQHASASSG